MIKENSQKELLIFMHTGFFSTDWVRQCNIEKDGWFSQIAHLKDFCRDGSSPVLFPECFKTDTRSAPTYNINDGNTFIDLVFCSYTQEYEKNYSINPYIFIQGQCYN